jgi:hypothetical protein
MIGVVRMIRPPLLLVGRFTGPTPALPTFRNFDRDRRATEDKITCAVAAAIDSNQSIALHRGRTSHFVADGFMTLFAARKLLISQPCDAAGLECDGRQGRTKAARR